MAETEQQKRDRREARLRLREAMLVAHCRGVSWASIRDLAMKMEADEEVSLARQERGVDGTQSA